MAKSIKIFCLMAPWAYRRRLSRDLSPVTVEALGIRVALRRLAEDFGKTGKIQITADIDIIDNILSLQYDILLYRILQEGFNNIIKHSGAGAASLSLKRRDDGIHFDLNDNGKGCDFEKEYLGGIAKTGCLGLTTMRERVRTLGGALTIQSGKDAGTKLHFVIPIRDREIDNGKSPGNSGR